MCGAHQLERAVRSEAPEARPGRSGTGNWRCQYFRLAGKSGIDISGRKVIMLMNDTVRQGRRRNSDCDNLLG